MNYEALDEALKYIEAVNEGDETALWIIGGVYAAMITAFTTLGIIAHKQTKTVKAVLEDSKAQAEFKKVFKELQDGLKKNKSLDKYNKYLKYLDYNYKIHAGVGNQNPSEVNIDFNIIRINVEELFKYVYGVAPEEYCMDYWEQQPDNDKPAPKFENAVKAIEKAVKSFVAKVNSKVYTKLKASAFLNFLV